MNARAMWKGRIVFGKVAVPVRLYAAVKDRKVHFRLLHRKDGTPVAQRMVNPRTEEPVPREEVRRGYEIEKGEIVLLEDEELQSLEPEDSRDITISRFVEPKLIHHQFYDRPYYLGPDRDAAAYFALARALAEQGKEGLAHWTMRKKGYIGALRSKDGYLRMITLRSAGEVISAAELPRPASRPLEKQELAMAEQLVLALGGDFDPEAYRDQYRARVLELVAAKASGKTVRMEKVRERKPEVVSIVDMLKKSIEEARKERKIA